MSGALRDFGELPPIMSELTSSQVFELPKPNYRVTALIIASALFMEQLELDRARDRAADDGAIFRRFARRI